MWIREQLYIQICSGTLSHFPSFRISHDFFLVIWSLCLYYEINTLLCHSRVLEVCLKNIWISSVKLDYLFSDIEALLFDIIVVSDSFLKDVKLPYTLTEY